MNKKLIDADLFTIGIALYMTENAYLNDTALDVLKMVATWFEEAPTVDAVEVVHGRWILADDGDGDVCSVCGTDFCNIIYETGNWNYCPNCGAKMEAQHDF